MLVLQNKKAEQKLLTYTQAILKMNTENQKKRGPGRPALTEPKVAITLRVKPAIAQRFNDLCKLNGLSQSRMFAKLFEEE